MSKMTMDNHKIKNVAQRKEFNKYCLEEIETHLVKIESLIPEKNIKELDGSVVGTIMECAEQMEDMAMVYGYPGVESLAFNLASAMANFTRETKLMPDDIGLRVQIAVNAIRQMVRIDNETEEEKLIQEIMQTMQSSEVTDSLQEEDVPDVTEDPPQPAKEKASPIPAEFAELELLANDDPDDEPLPPPEPPPDSKISPQFEIKELDSLMKLVEEIENHKKKTKQNPPVKNSTQPVKKHYPAKSEPHENTVIETNEKKSKTAPAITQPEDTQNNSIDLDLSQLAEKKSQREDQAKEIEQVFNDIFKEETIENLNFLKQALEKTQNEQTLGEAIMRIKESCSGLRDAANCFRVNEAMPTMSLLDKLAKERLSFNKVPDEDVLKAIIIVEQKIRSYIDEGKPQNFNFKPLDKVLKTILDSHSENMTAAGFDQLLDNNFDLENTIKVVEEEKLLGKEPAPRPQEKKKVKVIFNDDDDRGRWMNKFK